MRWRPGRFGGVSLSEVEQAARHTTTQYHGAPLVYDPSQALLLVERLKAAKVRCVQFDATPASNNRLGRAMHQLLREGLLSIPDDEDLVDEFLGMRLTETRPGYVRLEFDRSAGSGHGDVVQAVALAALHLLERPVSVVCSWGGLELARRALAG